MITAVNLNSLDRVLIGGLVGVVLALLATLSLPKSERSRVRMNWLMLVIFGLVRLLNASTTETPPIERALRGVEYFFLLASIGRSLLQVILSGVSGRVFGAKVPRIMSDLLQALLLIVVALTALQATGLNPSSLLATSAVLTAVLGLSLQETLGNLFAGLAIQAEEPFQVGDFILFEAEKSGTVVEINWRATKILTNDRYVITVPNGVLARASIVNYSRPEPHSRRAVFVDVPYDAPIGVPEILVAATRSIPGIEAFPSPDAIITELASSSIRYKVRYYSKEYIRREEISGNVLSACLLALRRHSIEIPFPVRRLEMPATEPLKPAPPNFESSLERISLFGMMSESGRKSLGASAKAIRFGKHEKIVSEGDEGHELFVLERGSCRVEIGAEGHAIEVAKLSPGEIFGEMSVFTGEPRSATVIAETEILVLVIDGRHLKALVTDEPSALERISEELARRQTELATALAARGSIYPTEGASQLQKRIRSFFGLEKNGN